LSIRYKLILPILTVVLLLFVSLSTLLYQIVKQEMHDKELSTIEMVRISMENSLTSRVAAEAVMEREMIGQSVLVSYIASLPGTDYTLIQRLTEAANIDEVWIADHTGNTVITNAGEDIAFDFSVDPEAQAYEFMSLLSQDASAAITQSAQQRTLDQQVFKYVGVGGWESPAIVQVGREGSALTELEQQVGIIPMLSDLQEKLQDNVLFAAVLGADGSIAYASDEEVVKHASIRAYISDPSRGTGDQALETSIRGERATLHHGVLSNGQGFVVGLSGNVLSQILSITFWMTVIGALLIIILIFWIVQRQFRRIKQMEDEMINISHGDGDLTQHIQVTSKDELGSLGRAFNQFVDHIHTIVKQTKEVSRSSTHNVEQIKVQSEQTAIVSSEINSSIREIAESAARQAIDAERSMQAVQGVAEEIQHTYDQAEQLESTQQAIKEKQMNGAKAVQALEENMQVYQSKFAEVSANLRQLMEDLSGVGEFVQTIQVISNQTNMLALNASIEASRAGEEGRGFSVVANEVRKLAEQSHQASEKIKASMGKIVISINHTSKDLDESEIALQEQMSQVEHTSRSFYEIEASLEGMIHLIEEVKAISSRLASSKDNLVTFMESTSAITEQTASGAEEVLASVESQLDMIQRVAGQAEELNRSMLDLRETVDQFKTNG